MHKETAQTILDKPVTVTISTPERVLWMPWKRKTVSREYQISPLTLGSLIRISEIVLDIEEDLLKPGMSMVAATHKSAKTHGKALREIVAIGLTNEKKYPSKKFIDRIEYSVTSQQLIQLYSIIIRQMDVTSFMASIISIRGVNLLKEMNPKDQRSQVASGAQSED